MYLVAQGSAAIQQWVADPAVRPGKTGDYTLIHIAGIMGYTAFFSMAATVIWGVVLGSRILDHHVHRATLYGAHMMLAILAITTSIIHAMLHIFRHDAFFDVKKVVIPWLGGADTVVSTGILGLEIVVVVAFSIWMQRRISYRRWHRLHWWAYPGFLLIAFHSALASKEQHFGIIWATFALMMLAIIALAANRMLAPAMPQQADSESWFDLVEDYRDRTYLR
jgi:DMSO/TMAO reductase YedYZ heme-binding membrane subunit